MTSRCKFLLTFFFCLTLLLLLLVPPSLFPASGQWRVFTGNELGALLGWWMFHCWKQQNSDPAAVKSLYMLSSTVSSKILRAIALKEGFHFEVKHSHVHERKLLLPLTREQMDFNLYLHFLSLFLSLQTICQLSKYLCKGKCLS